MNFIIILPVFFGGILPKERFDLAKIRLVARFCCQGRRILFDLVFFHPVAKGWFSHLVTSGDKFLRGAVAKQCFDLGPESIQLTFARSLGPAQLHAGKADGLQGFLCPFADQFALDLSGHGKDHGHDFTLDSIVQLPAAFDGIDPDTFFHCQGNDPMYSSILLPSRENSLSKMVSPFFSS